MNIVFILADDLGWSDTTLYGTTEFYQTPHLERLAKRGMVFSRAYSASPLCSPTRASLLTGQNPARIGITAPNCHLPEVKLKASLQATAPAHKKALQCLSATRFDTEYFTMAEALKGAGYATAHFGKWHLGAEPFSPLEHGFDVDLPHTNGPGPSGGFVAPWKYKDFVERTPEEHIEDRMGDEAVAWMEANKDEPFFLNYWQFSVHAPFDAKQSLIEKHRARVNPDDPQRSPTYAAMIESMDDNIGKILDAIDRLGIADRTAIVFFSDNGGNMYNEVDGTTPTSNAPLRGGKATAYEGGTRVPCIVSWPKVTDPGSRSATIVDSTDFYPTFLGLLDLKPQPGQIFDGVDITPALQGKPLERNAIFSFFPHSPGVPDTLPPSVTVTTDEWKLIRLFYEGENGTHAYRLYNLANDIGESHDLSTEQPERVKALDTMIDAFLSDTDAVVPKPNPAYRPGATAGSLSPWNARGCKVVESEGNLVITGEGAAPFISYGTGKSAMSVNLRARSTAGGKGKIEWLPTPTAKKQAKTVEFNLKAGEWTEISHPMPEGGDPGIIRIYVPASSAPVELDWVELKPLKGKSKRWDF
ncbi:MAG: sulfatase [Akkermansiaceae bacterium]|nr:sulfatase [Akkermansiaceae bacterium]MDP4646977.1 sulfatase [Akkermansiaceae bacterium]MDP4722623.1 sulfatase [Akkermansiaceae bacterium]MDP4780208.1 sulfatase [Akkermansiaceae bacterium]MDP4847543.1 sulfatase [Akkermansiaceae bacterium]